MTSATAFVIAANLASAYDILVEPPETSTAVVPQFNIMLGETAFEVIDRVCKYSGLLAYESVKGHLILSRVGTDEHASGLFEGQNVTAASVEYSMDQRCSQYIGWLNPMVRVGGNSFVPRNFYATGPDPTVSPPRTKFIIAEAVNGFQSLLSQRLNWEMNHRNGRSKVARVTVDSWLDVDKNLWTPNQQVPVYLPKLKHMDADDQPYKWTIGVMDERGTRAEITAMAPASMYSPPS